ncbi:MAG: tetratricopeptide repeat protein [Sandaracinus sp.]
MTRPIVRSLLLGVFLIAAVPSFALAQTSDDDQAHAHFQVAASYYEQANYEAALREFLEAYRLSQRSQLFYNLSLCYQQLGDLPNAVDYLTRYLHDVTDIANRASLETRLENLRARLAAQQASTSGGGSTESGSTESGSTESGSTESGSTESGSTESGSTGSGGTESGSGSGTTAPPPSSEGGSLNVGAIASFSVAGVGLILGAVFTGLAASEDGRVGSLPCAASRSCPDSELSAMRTDALVADIMWGVSLAGAAVGLVLLLVDPGSSSGSSDAHASLRVVPGGVSLEGSF